MVMALLDEAPAAVLPGDRTGPETIHAAVLPGDGIGPEIMQEMVKILDAASIIGGYKIVYRTADVGGAAVDKELSKQGLSLKNKADVEKIDSWSDDEKRKLSMPQETIDTMDWARDNRGIILFGSVGRNDLPKRVAELALLAMRKRYDLINNRPLDIKPQLAHLSVLFRKPVKVDGFEVISPEESLFNSEPGDYGTSENPGVFTRKQLTRSKLEKTVDQAFRKVQETGKSIMCAAKPNILVSDKLLSEVFDQYARLYAGKVKLNEWTNNGQLIIDNAGMQMAANPQRYNNTLVVADAMFGQFLQAIVTAVGTGGVNKDSLMEIKEKGLHRVFVRELCSDMYFGQRKVTPELAYDTCEYDKKTIEYVAAFGRKINAELGINGLDSLEVAGIPTFDFWARVLDADSLRYGYALRHFTVEEAVNRLLKDPASFRTFLGSNMIGDVFTDFVAAVAVGKSLGVMPSSEVNLDGFGDYQQLAGSAPDIAGQGIANPMGQILSGAMALWDVGDRRGAKIVRQAVDDVVKFARTKDIWEPNYKLVGTREFGDLVVERMYELAA